MSILLNGVSVGGGKTLSADTLPNTEEAQRVKIITGGTGVDGGPVTPANPYPVAVHGGLAASSVVAGRASVTTAVAALPNVIARRYHVRASLINTGWIELGPSGFTDGFRLNPGDWFPVPLELANLNVVFAKAESGTQSLDYLGEV